MVSSQREGGRKGGREGGREGEGGRGREGERGGRGREGGREELLCATTLESKLAWFSSIQALKLSIYNCH